MPENQLIAAGEKKFIKKYDKNFSVSKKIRTFAVENKTIKITSGI